MARPTKKEQVPKAKAMWEAVYELIEKSTPTKNLLTEPAVIQIANSSEKYKSDFETPIGKDALKRPSNKEYKEIKEKIAEHKANFKRMKSVASDSTKKRIKDLEEQVDSLLSELNAYQYREIKKDELLLETETTLERVKAERDGYIKRLEDDD